MNNDVGVRGTLTAKIDAFALTLSTPEQVLLAELISAESEVAGFGARPIWPGLANLRPDLLVPASSESGTKPDGLVDVALGGTDI